MKVTLLGNQNNPTVMATISALSQAHKSRFIEIVDNHEDCQGVNFYSPCPTLVWYRNV